MGFDIVRFPEVSRELICSICAAVLENPVELPCRHVFCSQCISRWLDTNHSCPNCRRNVRIRDLKSALPLLKNIIGKLKIRCDFVQRGCTEIVELERLGAHTSVCPFSPMTCENEGCELTFSRRSQADHEAECPERLIFCSSTCSRGCGLQLRPAELPGHNCVKSLKSRVEELERTVSDYSHRMSTLEETVNELRRQRETDQLHAELSQRSGLANDLRHSEANRQQDVDSGVISLLSEDEESESSPTVGFGGITSTHTVSLTTVELPDTLMTGQREFRRQRSLRRSRPCRERSRSRSPLRQNESQDGTSRRDRERSPSESSCTRRTTRQRRPCRPKPFTPSSPSASTTCTSTNNSGHSDSPAAQSRERRHNRLTVIHDSSSVDTPRTTGEIWHNVTGTEVLEFDRIPERAVFSTPPDSTEVSAYFGDRHVHQWLQRAIGESPSNTNSNSTGSSSSNTNSSSSPSTSC